MTRVLLVGGAGYVGIPVARHLVEHHYEVTVLDSFVYGSEPFVINELKALGVDVFRGDLRNLTHLAEAARGCSISVLLAGLVGDPIVRRYPEQAELINRAGIREAISFLGKHLDHLVFVSTCSNYGVVDADQLATEQTALNPVSEYARAKVEMEGHLLSDSERSCPSTVLRFATAFGVATRMRFDLTVNEFAKELCLGRELEVYDPDTWRPYCHVVDFAEIILRTIRAPNELNGEVLNAGDSRNNYTKRQIAELAYEIIGRGSLKFVDKGSDPRNYRVSFEKINEKLGFGASYSIRDGIEEVAEFVDKFVRSAESTSALDTMGNYEVIR